MMAVTPRMPTASRMPRMFTSFRSWRTAGWSCPASGVGTGSLMRGLRHVTRQHGGVPGEARPAPELPHEPGNPDPADTDQRRQVEQPVEGDAFGKRRLDPPEQVKEAQRENQQGDPRETTRRLLDASREQQQKWQTK